MKALVVLLAAGALLFLALRARLAAQVIFSFGAPACYPWYGGYYRLPWRSRLRLLPRLLQLRPGGDHWLPGGAHDGDIMAAGAGTAGTAAAGTWSHPAWWRRARLARSPVDSTCGNRHDTSALPVLICANPGFDGLNRLTVREE